MLVIKTKLTFMLFFLSTILPILYIVLVIAFFYAIFSIRMNGIKQTQLLQEILHELRANKNNNSNPK